MSLFLWMVVGAAIGWVASHILKNSSYGQMSEIALGVVAAVAAGIAAGLILGMNTISGLNLETIVSAALGAAIAIVGLRAVRLGRASAQG
jgi:uncharacterized membrane protein YeaQ/YmgE (transglycosylase-associated protein family)